MLDAVCSVMPNGQLDGQRPADVSDVPEVINPKMHLCDNLCLFCPGFGPFRHPGRFSALLYIFH